MSTGLLADVIAVRNATGRPLDEAGIARIANKILLMPQTEVDEELIIVRNLKVRLGLTTKQEASGDQP